MKGASTLRATINNFGASDQVDFEAVKYASTDTVRYARRVVTVDNSRGAKVASFDVSGSYTGANFALSEDGSGHLLVRYVDPPANAAIDEAGADILGGFATEFAEPPWAQASDLSAFDSWEALGSNAGTDRGGFDFRHDGTAGAGLGRRRCLEQHDRSRAWT